MKRLEKGKVLKVFQCSYDSLLCAMLRSKEYQLPFQKRKGVSTFWGHAIEVRRTVEAQHRMRIQNVWLNFFIFFLFWEKISRFMDNNTAFQTGLNPILGAPACPPLYTSTWKITSEDVESWIHPSRARTIDRNRSWARQEHRAGRRHCHLSQVIWASMLSKSESQLVSLGSQLF